MRTKRQPKKLKYLKNIRDSEYNFDFIKLVKNIPAIDTSDINQYVKEFESIIPVILKNAFPAIYKGTNKEQLDCKCLDLNKVLKCLAITFNFKFDGKEIGKEDIQQFKEELRWTNQKHEDNFQHYSLNGSLLSIIITLAKNDTQVYLTLYCLYRKIPDLLSYFLYNEFKLNVTNKTYNWTRNIATLKIYNSLFQAKYKENAKIIYKKYMEEETPNSISTYLLKTYKYLQSTTANSRFFKIYRELMYVLIVNHYDFFKLVIYGLTKYEVSVLSTEFTLLTKEIHNIKPMKPIHSLYYYFLLNKDKNEYLTRFIRSMNSQEAYNLLCFLKGDYNEEIITTIFNKINHTKKYLLDENIFSLTYKLSKKYPNNVELGKYLSKRIMLEIENS